MKERSSEVLWGMVALALSFIIAALIISGAAVKVKRAQDAIEVTGSARMQVESDYAVWQGSI
ncbi:SIMPL domain-containing protein, partial [bacterium]|nr:SIMPL domain-containing protein [bacterium]